MDYVVLSVSLALGILGVVSKAPDRRLNRTSWWILALIFASYAFGCIQIHEKRKVDASSRAARLNEISELKSQLDRAREENSKAQALLSKQSQINLIAVLSAAPPVKTVFLSISTPGTLPTPHDRIYTLLGDDSSLRDALVSARFEVSIGFGTLDVSIKPNGPLLTTGRFEWTEDGVRRSIRLDPGEILVDITAEKNSFGNPAVVLDALTRQTVCTITLKLKTAPTAEMVAKLTKHLRQTMSDSRAAVELLETSGLAAVFPARISEPVVVEGDEIRIEWRTSGEPHLYIWRV